LPKKRTKASKGSGREPSKPAQGDRRIRQMRIVTEQGFEPTIVRGSRQAKILARYTSAVGHFLRSGESDRLSEFENQKIGNRRLITNPETLTELALAGEMSLDELYVHPGQTR
jgi:hypothetical protein